MNKFMRQTKGAISIFLIIVLLPTMTMAGVLLDLARTKLAQEVVVSSADLALNTVLTDYDKDLKDYFGLLASAQNTEDMIGIAREYFADSMISAGVTTSTAEAYADTVVAAFGLNDDVHDMLQISVEGTADIAPMANGAMNNPAMIKEGISEFMKYRSPVNGVADLFDKITESDIAEQLEDASAETKMIEARDAFNTAEKDLIKQAEKAYKAIKKYEEFKAHTGDYVASEAFLESFSQFLMNPIKNSPNTQGADNSFESVVEENFTEIYKHAHTLLTMNLFNTHNIDETLSISLLKVDSVSSPGTITTYSSTNKADIGDIKTLVRDLNSAITTYKAKNSALDTAWQNTGAKQSGDWGIQYWVKLTNNCDSAYASYVTAAEKVWKAAKKLENALDNAEENVFTDQKMSYISSSYVSMPTPDSLGMVSVEAVKDAVWDYYADYVYPKLSGGSYQSINSQINSVNTTENNNRLKLATVKEIFNIAVEMKKYLTDAEKAAELLNTAREEVSKLNDKIKTYKERFDDWKEAAYKPELNDSSMATEGEFCDRKLIEDLENNGMIDMTEDSVNKLAGRLENVYTLFNSLASDIKSIKYNGTKIIDVYDFKTFCTASKLNKSSIPVNESALRSYADETFSFSIEKRIEYIVISDSSNGSPLLTEDCYYITNPFHPVLTKTDLELYVWLEHKFGTPTSGTPLDKDTNGFDVSDEDSAEDADEAISGKADEKAAEVDTSESTTGHSFSEWSGATLPSGGAGAMPPKSVSAKLSDASDYVTSLFSDFSGTFGTSMENMRDDLYAEDYIFSMFTHDTFEKEGYYSQLSDDAKENITATNASNYYTSDIKSKWEGDDAAQTLTLNPRNAQYNWCYGGEIEYILYGNASNAANKATAYANIYLIRYALDLKPVFNLYWDDPLIDALAVALQTFAYIPVNFTKTVACLAITAAEAGMDIAYLKQGIPVLIYKSKEDDLFCNYRTVFMGSNSRPKPTEGIKLQYSDYLKIFLFVMFKTDENQIYLRTGDVIQANVSLATENYEFDLSKSQVFYTLTANVVIEPMWSRLLAIDDLGDLSTSKGWRSISITAKGGY